MALEINKQLKKLLDKLTSITVGRMKGILASRGKAQSKLISQVKIKVVITPDGLEIFDDMPSYSKFVDSGRRPGKQPPLRTIKSWCKSKGIPSKFAFPIARKIGERGLPATHFLNPLRELAALISKQSGPVVVESIKEMIAEINKKQNKK
jgi:hypothetical protein